MHLCNQSCLLNIRVVQGCLITCVYFIGTVRCDENVVTPRVVERSEYRGLRVVRNVIRFDDFVADAYGICFVTVSIIRLWRYRVGASERLIGLRKNSSVVTGIINAPSRCMPTSRRRLRHSKRKVYRAGPWENYATASLSPANTERIYCCTGVCTIPPRDLLTRCRETKDN
jgi:hypothetical protein